MTDENKHIHQWTVPKDVDERLDQYLAQQLPQRSRTNWAKLIRKGHVKVNGRFTKPSHKLRAGEEVFVEEPPPPPTEWLPEDIPIEVLYEEENFLVVNKPPDLLVHPAGEERTGTLINALLAITQDLSRPDTNPERLGIVHRLDRDTSGVLLVAKNNRAHEALAQLFRERKIHKEYTALTVGAPHPPQGVVDVPLGRSRHHWLKVIPRTDGRPAETAYKVLKNWQGHFAKVQLFPKTGRTHQIRVHLKYLGTPILCDPLYGRKKKLHTTDLGESEKHLLLKRQALHASRLKFQLFGRTYDFFAPWPEDLVRVEEWLDRIFPATS